MDSEIGNLRRMWTEHFDQAAVELFSQGSIKAALPRVDALEKFMKEGVDNIWPMNFDDIFEHEYYVEVHPEYAAMAPAEMYRRWLFVDFDRRWPGSARTHLQLLGFPAGAYPEAFNWREYIAAHPEAGPNRWSALEHLLSGNVDYSVALPVAGPRTALFYMALATCYRGRDNAAAARWFTCARQAGELSFDSAHLLADALFTQSEWTAALSLYEEAATYPSASIWTFVNGARSAVHAADFDSAFALLQVGKGKVGSDERWGATVTEIVTAEFSSYQARAEALLRAGARSQSEGVTFEAIAKCLQRWRALFAPAQASLMAQSGRIIILANMDLRQCVHYRVEQKIQMLSEMGRVCQVYDVRTEVSEFISALPGAEAAIIYRVAASALSLRALMTARDLGVRTFYDIDDLIFDASFPEPVTTYSAGVSEEAYLAWQMDVPLVRGALGLCDYALAPTRSLALKMEEFTRCRRSWVLPNGLDNNNESFLEKSPRRVRRDDAVVIFYGSGTPAHNSDMLDLTGEGLLTVLRGSTVRVVIAGILTLDDRFEEFSSRITHAAWTPDIAQYWSLMAEADIVIAPLNRSIVTDAKSEIKWLEAAALSIPAIVSGTATYREILTHGVDAMIADTSRDWTDALQRLVGDSGLRRSIGNAARDHAAKAYTLKSNGHRLEAVFSSSQETQNINRLGNQRVLIVEASPVDLGTTEVFHRIAANHKYFRSQEHSCGWEFAILKGLHSNAEPYRLWVEGAEGGSCLFNLTLPYADHDERHPFDPQVDVMAARVLASWMPSIVHIQTTGSLAVSIIQACVSAGIPFAITVNDAWWISQYRFLLDDAGQSLSSKQLALGPNTTAPEIGRILDHIRRLRTLLDSAAVLFSSSAGLAEVYRAQGCGVTLLAGGISPLPVLRRVPSKAGRVRVLYAGGRNRHNGYDLIRAAFISRTFKNVDLHVVDYGRLGGECVIDAWGSNAVTFIGRNEQRYAETLYQFDVLLNPSIWLESFSLIGSEALNAGLWVVASDRCTIGESVECGVNGWVIDVSDVKALISVLEEIDHQPERFSEVTPECSSLPRSSDNEALELLEAYHQILSEASC